MAKRIDLSPEQAEQMVRHVTPGYRMVRLLGSGSFGQVFLVTDDQMEVAVKIVPLHYRAKSGSGEGAATEREESHEWYQLQHNWDRLNHASLVRIRHFFTWTATDEQDPIAVYGLIYMDYWPIDLYDCVKQLARAGRLTPARQYAVLIHLAVLLQRLLADTGLIVTDLKLENVLVSSCQSGPLALAMIDLGGVYEERLADYFRVVTTDFYMAPELHNRSITRIDEPILIYSFGIVGLFVLEGRWPVEKYDYLQPLLLQLRAQGRPDWSPSVRESMSACIQVIETCLREDRSSVAQGGEGGRYPTMAAVVDALQKAYQGWIDRDRPRISGPDLGLPFSSGTGVVGEVPDQRSMPSALPQGDKNVWREPLTGMELLWIPPGRFWMGQTEEETRVLRDRGDADHFEKWYARELPRHPVELDGFWMGRLPVTRGQFAWFVEESLFQTDQERLQSVVRSPVLSKPAVDPWNWQKTRFGQDDRHPVVFVSWFDAVRFAQWLSHRTGLSFALPTEAQWEYACRGGSVQPFHYGHTIQTDQANYYGGSVYGEGVEGLYRKGTTPGGLFPPNDYGLQDMHGNVWEWCQDKYDGAFYGTPAAGQKNPVNATAIGYRIKRGGSWRSEPDMVRSAYRGGTYPNIGKEDIGFRLVLSGWSSPYNER